jgi:urease accessory protein UreE
MADTVVVQKLPEGAADGAIVELPMSAHDRRRIRRIVDAADGTRLALELATGTVLVPGQVLYRSGGRAYVVVAKPEEVIVARPRSLDEATKIGHIIGNLHRDLEAAGDCVIALADTALTERLRRAGVSFVIERRAFNGRAAGEHAH